MTKSPAPDANRLEKVLAYMIVGVLGASILSLLAVLISAAIGATGLPAIIMQLPLIGFPIGFLLIITLLVTNLIGQKRKGN